MDAVTRISGSTRLVGLIGSPVTYSGSPAIHNAVFERMGYDYAFVPFNVKPENLESAVRGMEALGFLGYNVTAPYKNAIVPYLHEISRTAEIMGAVSTVVIQNGRSLGDNADGAAFMRNLVLNGINVRGKKITVLGAGGAASAVAVQAALDGVAQIDVFNRQESYLQRGYELIDRLHGYSPCEISLYALSDEDQLRASLAESALVVNTTTVGYPDDPGCLLTADMLRPELIVADLVYNPLTPNSYSWRVPAAVKPLTALVPLCSRRQLPSVFGWVVKCPSTLRWKPFSLISQLRCGVRQGVVKCPSPCKWAR